MAKLSLQLQKILEEELLKATRSSPYKLAEPVSVV
jgi:hypothetical protein